MAYVELEIPPGVVRPATPLQAKGRYWDANLIRWRSGKLLPVGGWQRISEDPLASTCRSIFTWLSTDDIPYGAFGCDSNLYAFSVPDSTITEITPSAFVPADIDLEGGYSASTYGSYLYGDPTGRPVSPFDLPTFSWTFDNWGTSLLAVASSDGRLLQWVVGDDNAHAVGTAAISSIQRQSNTVTVTCAESHDFLVGDSVVIAGVTTTSFDGTFTVVSVPTADTFTYSQAGTNTTSSGGTATSGSVPIDNRGVIVTEERHVVLFGAGGNPRRVAWSDQEDYVNWEFANPLSQAGYFDLDTHSKILMAVAVRDGTLILTENEAWLMRYIGLPYIYSFDRVGEECGIIAPMAFANFAGRCVWMGREGFWMYDGGFVRQIPCDVGSYVFDNIDATAGRVYTNGANNGIFPEVWFWYPSDGSSVPDRYVIYNYSENWWSVGQLTRTAAANNGVTIYPLATDENNEIYYQENGWTAAGVPITTQRYAETGSLDVSRGAVTSMVRQAITDSGYGYDSTALTFYSTYTPDGSETTFGPYSPRSDGYTDVRFSGRDYRMKVESTEDAEWSIGNIRLDLVPRGGR